MIHAALIPKLKIKKIEINFKDLWHKLSLKICLNSVLSLILCF